MLKGLIFEASRDLRDGYKGTAISFFLGEEPGLGYLFILETGSMLSKLALNFASACQVVGTVITCATAPRWVT